MFQLSEFLKNQASAYWLVLSYYYEFFLNTGLILTYKLIYPILVLFNWLWCFVLFFEAPLTMNIKFAAM